MAAFVLDANLRIQQILGLEKIKQQLAGIQIPAAGQTQQLPKGLKNLGNAAAVAAVQTNKVAAATTKLGTSAQTVGKQMRAGSKEVKGFGDQVFLAGKRYGAFIVATAVAFKGLQLIGSATDAVRDFDQAIVSLSQILDKPLDQLSELSDLFLDLSVQTGTSAAEIAGAGKLLAQAGFRGDELTEAIKQLAKVPLTPIFENMEQAVDGAIAAMRQFSSEGLTVEQVFDKMTAVSNQFAASFPDIITGLQRGGSAFSAVGGSLDEFIAAFTTIRSVTRESASAVGTSLKTISSRLADPKILDFLETKGIRLIDDGQFVGVIEGIKRIGVELQKIQEVPERANILTRLGGRRQFSRIVAITQNFEKTSKIIDVSATSAGAFNKVVEQGLKSINAQINILVAQAKKLAVALGPDLFIPFIKGLTSAGEAAVSLLNVLRPILPIIAQIGAFLTSAAIAKGIGSFVGPRLAQLAGPAAFAAAAGGRSSVGAVARGAGAGLRASPFAQAGLLLAGAQLASSFTKTSEGVDTFATSLITTTALVSAAIALFRKQTIAQFATAGGLFPSLGKLGKLGALGGGIATVGVVGVGLAVAQAQQSVKELSDRIIDNAVQSVKAIKIESTDPKSVSEGINDLFQILSASVQELQKSADIRTDPSISKFFEGASRQFGNIITGDFESLIRRGGLTTSDINGQVKAILDKNPEFIENIIKGVAGGIVGRGGDVQQPSAGFEGLFKDIADLGLEPGQARDFANIIVDATGGLKTFSERILENVATLKLESEERKNIIQLTKLFIPPRLIGDLLQFSKAVDATTRTINISARLFETQVADIAGGIRAPTFDFDFGADQIEGLIRSGGLKELFAFTPDIPKFIGGISEIEDLVDQLILNISSTPGDVNVGEQLDQFFKFQTNVPEAVRNNFESFFQIVADDIRLASEGQFISAGEIKDRFEKEFSKLGVGATDAAVDTVGKFLKATFAQIQDELNRLATIRGLEIQVPVTPASQAAFLEQQLGRVGINAGGARSPVNLIRGTFEELELLQREAARRGTPSATAGFLPTPPTGFFQGRGQRLADIAGDERTRQKVRDGFREVVIASAKIKKELAELKPDSKGFIDASERAKELARETIEYQTTLEALDQATQQALQSELATLKLRQQFEIRQTRTRVSETVRDPLVAQRIIFDLEREHLREQVALQDKSDTIIEKDNALRVSLAKEISASTTTQAQAIENFGTSTNVFAEAAQLQATAIEIFGQNIGNFGQAIVNFTNLNATQPIDEGVSADLVRTRIRTGGLSPQQGLDEFNRLLGEGNNDQKEMVAILQDILDAQGSTQPTQRETSNQEKQQERDVENNEKISLLTESLDGLRTVLSEPNELRIITDQRIDLDLSTLPLDISEEIRPLLEEAVMVAARTVTRKALESLAAKTDSETSIAATDVAQELLT